MQSNDNTDYLNDNLCIYLFICGFFTRFKSEDWPLAVFLRGEPAVSRRVGLNTAGYCRIPQVTAGDRRVPQDTFISIHYTLF